MKKFLSSICLVCLLVVFLCPSSVLAATISKYESMKNINTVMNYITITDDNLFIFNEELAKHNGEQNNIIEIGNMVEAWSLAEANISTNLTRDGIPFYGNWCGPGHGSGDPIDALDAACRTHDICYGDYGYFNCQCDYDLLLDIYLIKADLSPTQLTAAEAIITYFMLQTGAHCD